MGDFFTGFREGIAKARNERTYTLDEVKSLLRRQRAICANIYRANAGIEDAVFDIQDKIVHAHSPLDIKGIDGDT